MQGPAQPEGETLERTVTIVNSEGLHARPSGALVAVAQAYASELRISCEDREINGRSILELISLGAKRGTELRFRARGTDAEALLDHLTRLVESGFDELN
ncbi:MAG: HPr family phosphocarrier protein [Planctomycetes bacterium]|nr:HPr family phosphocarrier protein [Planctomycetota bacterium]